MSFITEFWGLDQYFDPFNTPKDVKMFQSKLLDALKIYIVSSISLNLVARIKVERKVFGGHCLIQRIHYLWMINTIILPLHSLVFEVIC